MELVETSISGVIKLESESFQDSRGAFSRFYCSRELNSIIDSREIVQINHSLTRNVGAVRGLHFQNPPHAEMKIIRCLKGSVFDVAVDLRRESHTFLKWMGIELTSGDNVALVIPEGCAHGFQVLEKDCELLYLHTACYSPEVEGGIRHDDPRVGIIWPLPPTDLSARDLMHPFINEEFKGMLL